MAYEPKTFVKDGVRKTAATIDQEVALKFEGYRLDSAKSGGKTEPVGPVGEGNRPRPVEPDTSHPAPGLAGATAVESSHVGPL